MDVVTVDGRTIAYRRAGRGAPLVLLHGGWSDSREWSRQLEAFSDEFDVVAWDAPGCGGSADPPVGFGMAGYADAVAGLIESLGLDRPHLVGVSFGSGLAIAVYERHPGLVRSIVLASAYAGWAGSLSPDEIATRVDRIRTELRQPPDEWIASYLPSFFAGPVAPDVLDAMVTVMRDVRPAGMLAMMEAFAAADLRHVLPDIDVPTLLLYGGADMRSPRSVAEAIHAAIPQSELVTLPGVGHSVNLEAPEAFNDEVRRFVRAVANSSP
jgi:pimeloyl-ACP methyl ester carboxylesterase